MPATTARPKLEERAELDGQRSDATAKEMLRVLMSEGLSVMKLNPGMMRAPHPRVLWIARGTRRILISSKLPSAAKRGSIVADNTKGVNVADVSYVYEGATFKGAHARGVDTTRCLTIVASERSVSFMCKTEEERDRVAAGMRQLIAARPPDAARDDNPEMEIPPAEVIQEEFDVFVNKLAMGMPVKAHELPDMIRADRIFLRGSRIQVHGRVIDVGDVWDIRRGIRTFAFRFTTNIMASAEDRAASFVGIVSSETCISLEFSSSEEATWFVRNLRVYLEAYCSRNPEAPNAFMWVPAPGAADARDDDTARRLMEAQSNSERMLPAQEDELVPPSSEVSGDISDATSVEEDALPMYQTVEGGDGVIEVATGKARTPSMDESAMDGEDESEVPSSVPWLFRLFMCM